MVQSFIKLLAGAAQCLLVDLLFSHHLRPALTFIVSHQYYSNETA
jgi:hypothetical protein